VIEWTEVMASSKQFQNRSATLAQKWQQLWRNPSAVSAIASLGAHGLLFLALPFLPDTAIKATEPEIRRSVEVMELTPEEQKRLPDFSTLPPIELPPLAQPPKPGESEPFSFSDLPKPPSNLPQPSDSLLAPPPLPIFIPPIPPPTQLPYRIEIPTTPPVAASPQPSPSPEATETPQPNPTAAPEEIPPVEDGLETPQANAETPEQPSPTPRSEEQIQQDLVARQQELRELYTYNPSGTSVEDGNIAFGTWFREVFGKDYGEGDAKPLQAETTAEYPKLACPLKQSPRAVVGVVVDAANNIVGEPKVLQSSGYRLFNQEALKVVESYEFGNSSGKEQAYLLGVKFEYSEEVCPPGFTPAPTG
jgi:outer membrane biosynthesis protein TonB